MCRPNAPVRQKAPTADHLNDGLQLGERAASRQGRSLTSKHVRRAIRACRWDYNALDTKWPFVQTWAFLHMPSEPRLEDRSG